MPKKWDLECGRTWVFSNFRPCLDLPANARKHVVLLEETDGPWFYYITLRAAWQSMAKMKA